MSDNLLGVSIAARLFVLKTYEYLHREPKFIIFGSTLRYTEP